MKPDSLLIHYGEIALKGKNRSIFEKMLAENVRIALKGTDVRGVEVMHGRIIVRFAPDSDVSLFIPHVRGVFGAANATSSLRVGTDFDEIRKAVFQLIEGRKPTSFAVRARRSEKGFPLSSQEINERIGALVQQEKGWRVDLGNPDLTIGIEVLKDRIFVFADRVRCVGGLPVGMSGMVGCLISGGIDSPVAAWRMMKRGCRPLFIHFHSAPFTTAASQDKTEEIVERLMRGQPSATLAMVPFGPVQQKIVISVPAKYRVVLYRRFMVRIACAIACRHGAQALASGEALSQVASQTLSNLATIDEVSSLPILRPLIGYDKQEIVDEAREIGTYEFSIQPHDDCCSFLMPRHPITRSSVRELEGVERSLDVKSLIKLGLEGCQETRIEVGY
jgi:thiamine biosynthesis protein ThiI